MRRYAFFFITFVAAFALADEYESVFSREYCAHFLKAQAEVSAQQYGKTPQLAHYKATEITTLAYRSARRNLSWAQYEAVNDDLIFFMNSFAELGRLRTNRVVKAYFPDIEEFNADRHSLLRQTLRAELEILNYISRFFDAYVSVGDHSENYGTRPIISREQVQIAHAYAVSSDKTFHFRTYRAMIEERPRHRLIPTLEISKSDYEALERLNKLSRNIEIPPPVAEFIVEYRAFMERLNLPPSSHIYPLVEALVCW